jgi:SSS family solute:Na+ symporter
VVSYPWALRYIALSPDAKPMAENLYRALWSWCICVLVTIVVSLFTTPKPAAELKNLVYGFTRTQVEDKVAFYKRPVFWGAGVAVVFAALQIAFW